MGTTQKTTLNQPPLFALGQIVATPTVLEHLKEWHQQRLSESACGDWGDVPECDAAENDFALNRRLRLLSAYTVAKERIWILTTGGRQKRHDLAFPVSIDTPKTPVATVQAALCATLLLQLPLAPPILLRSFNMKRLTRWCWLRLLTTPKRP